MIHLVRTDSHNPDLESLIQDLDRYLRVLDRGDATFYAQYNQLVNINEVVIAYRGDKAVGCGAIKKYSEERVEVKRMYVAERYRGMSVASSILTELESWAKELGFSSCILETGRNNPRAIAFYEKMGYGEMDNFGQYIGIENSICLIKHLR